MRRRPPKPTPLAETLARWGLPSSPALPADALSDEDFAALRAECEVHRLIGLLAAAIDAGDFPVTDRQHTELAAQARRWSAVELRGEQLLLRTAAVLHEADVQCRLLKGPALARLAYPHVEWRTFGDIDLLVPSPDFGRAAALVAKAIGGVRVHPEPRPGFDDCFGREILLAVDGIELDLHRTLISGYYGLVIPLAELFEGHESVLIGGSAVPVLPPVPRLLHAAIAAAVGDAQPRLIARRDLAQLVLNSTVAIDEVAITAERWRCRDLLTVGLTVAADWGLAANPLIVWACGQAVPPSRRVLQAAYRSRFRGPAVAATGLLAPLTTRGRCAYAAGSVRLLAQRPM